VVDPSINCTADQLKEALEGHITTEAVFLHQEDTVTFSNMVRLKQFRSLQKGPVGVDLGGESRINMYMYVSIPSCYYGMAGEHMAEFRKILSLSLIG